MAPKRPARSPQQPIGTPGCAEVTTDQRIAELAARQHGLVTRAQLLGAGVGRDAVKYRVMKKRLRTVQRGVYQVGPLVSPRAREMAAVLVCGPGSVISHRNAAALYGLLPHRERDAVDATVGPEVRHRRPGIRLHRAALGRDEVTELDGIPATTAARTLLDLGNAVRLRDLEQASATAEEKRLTKTG